MSCFEIGVPAAFGESVCLMDNYRECVADGS